MVAPVLAAAALAKTGAASGLKAYLVNHLRESAYRYARDTAQNLQDNFSTLVEHYESTPKPGQDDPWLRKADRYAAGLDTSFRNALTVMRHNTGVFTPLAAVTLASKAQDAIDHVRSAIESSPSAVVAKTRLAERLPGLQAVTLDLRQSLKDGLPELLGQDSEPRKTQKKQQDFERQVQHASLA